LAWRFHWSGFMNVRLPPNRVLHKNKREHDSIRSAPEFT
jgi:hypothetical protein